PGAEVEVSGAGPNGGNMKTALQFMGDYRGEASSDHVQELPGVDSHATGTFVRGLDDFDKMDTELQKMPDDLAVSFRPITVLGKNAVGAVSKAAGMFKSVFKIA